MARPRRAAPRNQDDKKGAGKPAKAQAKTPERKLGEYLLHLVMYDDLLKAWTKADQKTRAADMTDFGVPADKQKTLFGGNLDAVLQVLADEYERKPGDHMGIGGPK